jgi:heat-inducible transcriptional repressor
VVEVAGLDVSAATVRNEMGALEELGLIAQPHTSAGRVPTDKGYRRFVDDLRANPELDGPRRELVEELLGSAHDVEDLLARTSTVLSQLTRLVSLVIAPAVDGSRLKLVELVSLTPGPRCCCSSPTPAGWRSAWSSCRPGPRSPTSTGCAPCWPSTCAGTG